MLRKRISLGVIFGMLLMPAALFAKGAMISVDSADFSIGTVHEGNVGFVKHTFKIKNTGDSALVIKQVKPG